MKAKQMQSITGSQRTHDACAPKDWREVPDVTGDYDLDATIMHRDNANLPARLNLYVSRSPAYGPLTGYNGYSNYHGDS